MAPSLPPPIPVEPRSWGGKFDGEGSFAGGGGGACDPAPLGPAPVPADVGVEVCDPDPGKAFEDELEEEDGNPVKLDQEGKVDEEEEMRVLCGLEEG